MAGRFVFRGGGVHLAFSRYCLVLASAFLARPASVDLVYS